MNQLSMSGYGREENKLLYERMVIFMTTIRLKNDLKPVNRCYECPFIEYQEETEFGEICGYTAFCSLSGSIIGDTRDHSDQDDKKLDDCPIISISVEKES